MNYIGIDPGKDGALAVIVSDKYKNIKSVHIHTFSEAKYNYVLRQLTYNLNPSETKCCLEKVGARPGQGVVSMFNFGQNFGYTQGLLTAYDIPFELVTPQKWKREFSVTKDKNTSISVARKLFPGVNLKRTDRCIKDHDGMAEALLMAEYARRKF